MRQSLSQTVITAMLLMIFVYPAAAQNATPASVDTSSLTPTVGVPFPYSGGEGTEQATITVSDVEDPFDEVLAGYEPAPDSRYVMLTVSYENTGSGPFETQPDAFVLQDGDGFIWSPTSITRDEDITIPDLQYVQLAPGDRITGMVGFQVPAEAELARIFYQPESSRLLLLADLVAAQPGPSIGTEVMYEDVDTTAQGLMTVAEIQDPFDNAPEGYEPEAGSRYVLVTIAIENTGSVPLDVSPSNLLVRDGDGFLWAYASVPREDNVIVPDLQSQSLAPGSRISGVVGFQLPADTQLADVLYQPVSGRLIILAQLQPAGTVETSAGAVATTAMECMGLDTWYAETSERISEATELSQQAALLEDEASLEAAALAFSELVTAQEAMNVPTVAEDVHAMLVDIFIDYHEALTQITTADGGGDVLAGLVEGTNAFNDASRDLAALQPQITDLAADCGIQT